MHPFCVFVIVFIASDLPIFISSAPRFQEGDIRLLGGRTRYEGTVLIYHNGEWGSICDRSWGRRDANVACRQLGYTRAMQSARGSRYGIGRNRRWMTRLRCRGSERRLDKCQFGEWGIRNDLRYCSARRRSAGVRCYPARMTRRRRPVIRAPRRRPVTSTPRPVTVRSTLKSTTITSTRPTTTPTTTTEKDKTTTNSGRRIVKTTKTPNEIPKSIISSTRRPVTSTPRPVIVRSTLKPTTIPSTRPTPKYKITTENNKATTNIYRGMVQTIKTTPAEIINNIISSVVEAPAPQGPPVLTGSLADPDPPGSPGPPGQPGTNEDILNNNIPSPQQPYSFVSSSSSRSNTDVVQTLSPLSNHIQVLGTNSSNNGRREQNINTTLIHIAENNNIVVDLPETGTTPLTVSDTITPIPVETPDEKNDINNSPVQSLTTTENISPETELRESSSATSETMPSYLNITLSPSTSIRTTVSFLTTTSSPRKETTTEKTTPSTSNVNVNGQNPDLVQNKWIKDKLLNAFVFLSRRGKILVSKDGGRPEQMTIAQYINKRREVILSTLSDINDIQSDSHSNNEGSNTVNDDQDRISGDTESIVYIDTGNEESTSDDAISNVILTSREETQSNNDQSTRAITATQNPTKTTTISTTTTMTPTLTTTTTTTPTLTTPTTTTTPTPATTTMTTTTSATTTTTTATTTTSPTTITTTTRAPVMNRINDPYEGIRLVVNRWTRDNDLDKWVLLSRTGSILIADAGDSPTRITQQEYIQRRRYQLMSNSVYSTGSESESVMIRDEQGTNSDMAAARQPPTVVRNLGDSDSEINLQIDDPNAIGQQRGNRRHRNRHRHGYGQNGHRRQGKVGIRLMGGRHSLDGRVEVLPPGGGRWGVICADKWTMKEAIVACRHLRKSYAQQPIKMDHYGGSDQMKYYSSVECSGREKSLQDCKWREHDGPVTCSTPKSVAGVVCTRALPDLEPDIYMLETSVSLQDRHLYYLQCAMEEKCLAPSAYRVQGSRGWRHATRRLMRFSSVVKNIGTADFKPISDRSQWEWHACHMHYHSMEVFAHYDILDNNGNRVAEGLKASFCLEDSACNPGIYPKYSCQNYGQQGISVGCSDNYMSDIDCQWIDITDLKPGKYTFKLEINPNLYVAETSFENNVIVCDLTYTGYYARIFNCNLKSLL